MFCFRKQKADFKAYIEKYAKTAKEIQKNKSKRGVKNESRPTGHLRYAKKPQKLKCGISP